MPAQTAKTTAYSVCQQTHPQADTIIHTLSLIHPRSRARAPHTQTQIRTHTRMHTHTHACTRAHTHTHTYKPIHLFTSGTRTHAGHIQTHTLVWAVIYMLPRICKLDGIEITNDEREQAEAAFAEKPTVPVVPTLNFVTNINTVAVKSEIKYTSKPPTRPTNQMPSPRPGMREPSPRPDNRGFESPRIMIGDTPRGPTPGGGNRPQSPYQSAQDSPRQIAALTGETNKHVLTALLSLVKELNLDGTPTYHPSLSPSTLKCKL